MDGILSGAKNYLGGCITGGLSHATFVCEAVLQRSLGPFVAIATFAQYRRRVHSRMTGHQTGGIPQSDRLDTHTKQSTPTVFILEVVSRTLCIDSRILRTQYKYDLEGMLHNYLSWLPCKLPVLSGLGATHLSVVVLGHIRRMTNAAWDLCFLLPKETDAAIARGGLDTESDLWALNLFALMSLLPKSEHSAWTKKYIKTMITSYEYLKADEGYYWLCEWTSQLSDRFGTSILGKLTVHTFVKCDGALCARAITVHRLPSVGAMPSVLQDGFSAKADPAAPSLLGLMNDVRKRKVNTERTDHASVLKKSRPPPLEHASMLGTTTEHGNTDWADDAPVELNFEPLITETEGDHLLKDFFLPYENDV